MNCAVHTDVDAVGYCRNCGKAMCSTCVRPVRDVLYCEDCLAGIMGIPGATPIPGTQPAESRYHTSGLPGSSAASNRSNPALAFFLGWLPGIGAFYNEQYGKGMIHIAIFVVLFILGSEGSMDGPATAALWICLAGFWIYMPVDAYRTARARNAGETLYDPLSSISKDRPIGPILLIGGGTLLLLRNFDWFPWYKISQFFWPLILIAVGVWMISTRADRRS